jgi:hypothetical protein
MAGNRPKFTPREKVSTLCYYTVEHKIGRKALDDAEGIYRHVESVAPANWSSLAYDMYLDVRFVAGVQLANGAFGLYGKYLLED